MAVMVAVRDLSLNGFLLEKLGETGMMRVLEVETRMLMAVMKTQERKTIRKNVI